MDLYRGDFNPRPYVRGDHSSLKQATRTRDFNPRPYVRGDPYPWSGRASKRHFNPRPYVRGDPSLLLAATIFFNFNPRPYVRGDPSYYTNITSYAYYPTLRLSKKPAKITYSYTFQRIRWCEPPRKNSRDSGSHLANDAQEDDFLRRHHRHGKTENIVILHP